MRQTVPVRVTPSTAKKVKEIMEYDPEAHLTRLQIYSKAVDAMHKKIFRSPTRRSNGVVGEGKGRGR